MKKIFAFAFLLLFSHFSFAQTPAVEWVESNSGGTYGASFIGISTPNDDFQVLFTSSSRTNVYQSLNKYNLDGKINETNFYTCNGSSSCPFFSRELVSTSQYGGVLLKNAEVCYYYSASFDLLWQKPFLFGSKASPLFGGGFYIKENDRIQINRLRRYSENGDLVFEVNFPVSMTQITNAIQTTSDNGVVILTNEGLIKYSLDGTLSYSNSLIANNIISLNNNSFGIYDNISFKKNNLSNGSIMWNYDLADIKSVKVLNDGGIVLLTASNLTKLDINGNLIWTTNYGGQSMVNFESNEVAVANQNVLTKLNPNGTLKWQKTFSPSILPYYGLNIFKASDEGMFVITHIATFNGTGNTPLAYLMKLSKDGNYCNYTSSINSNGTDICGTAKPLIARFNNKPLTDFPAPNFPIVPTTNFQLQWKKDGVVVGNNATFNAIDSGNYTLEIINGGCTVSSSSVSLTRLPANTTLSGIKTTNEIYKAETINSTQMIQPPVKVDYLAGRSVVLEAGFESKPNTVFMAKITGCN